MSTLFNADTPFGGGPGWVDLRANMEFDSYAPGKIAEHSAKNLSY